MSDLDTLALRYRNAAEQVTQANGSFSVHVPKNLDGLVLRARAISEALTPAEPAAAPATLVEVIAMPAPRHRWLLTVARDDLGRVQSILAEPVV